MLNRILLSTILFVFLGCNSQQDSKINSITTKDLKELLAKETIQLVDVRTVDEFQSGHIQNAKHIDFYASNFAEQFVDFNKDQAIYLYCHSGNRSYKASKILIDLGFTNVYNVTGGYSSWKSLP